MFAPIPEPIPDKSVLDWAIPVTRALNAIGDKVGAHSRNERDRRSDRPLPFEVRWDGTLSNGSGGWKIYLPTEHLLCWKGEYIGLGGVTAIEDANGDTTCWFVFDDIDSSSSHVWLVISESSSGSGTSASAEFSDTPDANAEASICIAEISYTAATSSTPASVDVKQSVAGAIFIGGEGSATIDASGTVVMSEDYVSSSGDPDFADHPYAIRIRRGTLSYNAATGALSITEAANLKQFIDTTPLSTVIT